MKVNNLIYVTLAKKKSVLLQIRNVDEPFFRYVFSSCVYLSQNHMT